MHLLPTIAEVPQRKWLALALASTDCIILVINTPFKKGNKLMLSMSYLLYPLISLPISKQKQQSGALPTQLGLLVSNVKPASEIENEKHLAAQCCSSFILF